MADSTLTDYDLHLFNEGTHCHLFDKLGAHLIPGGARFAVWAPNAERVSVIGDFNGWNRGASPLSPRGVSGIWQVDIPGVDRGANYKYFIESRHGGYQVEKADPFAIRSEEPPRTGSVVWDLDYEWGDAAWMAERGRRLDHRAPVSIYEVHLGSWMRDYDGNWLPYRELGLRLADHVERAGFTHVELMPVMEHPFYGSWGYQVSGYFAPTARYGGPQDLMFLIDTLHQRGIGVILDWVPAHFPTDEHALGFFDGTHLFEHADPRKGFHPDWTTFIYNYGRNEVRSFLNSSAVFWLERYHADGLRVDGVASMLYLDYSRDEGAWVPNEDGTNENRDAVSYLRWFNETVYREVPGIQTIAEESTAWSGVSRPTSAGGLGFGYKWDLGWMHDTLAYLSRDPIHRKHHHNQLTFRALYGYTENFVLPLSHDEVVHGKGSLLRKLPGDAWRKLAQMRLMLGYMYSLPGKKLLFMGGELGVWGEWNHESALDWALLAHPAHEGLLRWVSDLNATYRAQPALHERDAEPGGFEWIHADDANAGVLSFLRWGTSTTAAVACVLSFTPIPRDAYRVGLPFGGRWQELLCSDAGVYGGSGGGNLGGVDAEEHPCHGRPWSATLHLPAFSCVMLRGEPPR